MPECLGERVVRLAVLGIGSRFNLATRSPAYWSPAAGTPGLAARCGVVIIRVVEVFRGFIPTPQYESHELETRISNHSRSFEPRRFSCCEQGQRLVLGDSTALGEQCSSPVFGEVTVLAGEVNH